MIDRKIIAVLGATGAQGGWFVTFFSGIRPVEGSHALNPELKSFRQWLEANASHFDK